MEKFELVATINTGNYQNISPSIIGYGDTVADAKRDAFRQLKVISDAYSAFPDDFAPRRPKEELQGDLLKCFVGGTIYYNDDTHTYFNENGEVYLSGSKYAEQFDKGFDTTATATKMALKHNVSVDKILAAWNKKGEASRNFGTALHDALELYGSYRDISEALGKEYHIEYHPTLRKAVDSFYESHQEPNFICEAVVVDHNKKRAGKIDRLVITGESSCRIGDYKTNAKLNKAKLTVYWNQLSFYAAIMSAGGWKVEGLDIHHWDGDNWVEYQSEVLEVK
jgi:hypothetical protein